MKVDFNYLSLNFLKTYNYFIILTNNSIIQICLFSISECLKKNCKILIYIFIVFKMFFYSTLYKHNNHCLQYYYKNLRTELKPIFVYYFSLNIY